MKANVSNNTPWPTGLWLTFIFLCPVIPLRGQDSPAQPAAAQRQVMEMVRIGKDGRGFVLADSNARFVPWGFNFVGEFGHIVEEYWEDDWPSIEEDFRRMRELGANVVRLHLQVGTYMKTAKDVDPAAIERLQRTLDLARSCGLYLDLTGLGCYRLNTVPPWYDKLNEASRWQVQARFWEAIAHACAGHPAVFCYDLMNEPVITPAKEGEHPWLLGELEGFCYIGKPLVVEETFPLNCTLKEMDQFVDGANGRVDGWISHYFGYSIEEHAAGAKPGGKNVAEFLKYWRQKGACYSTIREDESRRVNTAAQR